MLVAHALSYSVPRGVHVRCKLYFLIQRGVDSLCHGHHLCFPGGMAEQFSLILDLHVILVCDLHLLC